MAVESIGTLVPTKIPGYADAADIQAALRAYHYGSYTFDTSESDPAELINPSIAYTITNLQTQITAIASGTVTPTNTVTLTNKTIGSTGLFFEGTTDDGYETLLTVVDPTADRTITFPDVTGTVALLSQVINNTLTTTTGDMIYASASNTPARLAIGTEGHVLTVTSGVPTWSVPTGGTSASMPDIFLMMGG
jgi:hypothetical protein